MAPQVPVPVEMGKRVCKRSCLEIKAVCSMLRSNRWEFEKDMDQGAVCDPIVGRWDSFLRDRLRQLI